MSANISARLFSLFFFLARRIKQARMISVPLRQAQFLAAAFVLYGLVATAFLAINIPPFQNPDEPNHFLRAAQIADGRLLGTRFSTIGADGLPRITAGSWADPAIPTSAVAFMAVPFHSERRVTRTNWEPPAHWSSVRAMLSFPNTVIYPPFFYLPSVVGVLVGRWAGSSVVQTLAISRVLTGIAAVTLGAAAIACAGSAAVWIFMVLTLPMSLSLIASSSHDGLILAFSALAGALFAREFRLPMGSKPMGSNWLSLIGMIVALGLVAMARPPYVALSALPLGLTRVPLRWRMLAAAAIAGFVAVWSGIVLATAMTNTGYIVGADPAAQMRHILGDPLGVMHAMFETLIQGWRNNLIEFVGDLGWLDTPLPPGYHVAARVMLCVAALSTTLGLSRTSISIGSRSVIVAGLVFSIVGIFAIQYLTWTVPGHSTVDGVNGRYLLPLALVGAGVLQATGSLRWVLLQNVLVTAVGAFPLITLAYVMRAVVLRYYLG